MLKLTKRADYGLIALKHLAGAPGHNGLSASAKEIADCYGIPASMLAKILQKLTRTGILTSLPGTNGGYRLARDPRRISALEVIRAIDGPTLLTSCFTEHGACDHSERCTVREPLRKVHEAILGLLETIKISDMSEKAPERDVRPARPEAREFLHVL
jgi:Rrf2 family protein